MSTRSTRAMVVVVILAACAALARAQPAPVSVTVASVIDKQISAVEKLTVDAADAMPEAKWEFSPESLNIPGSAYTGVRTFAVQVKHLGASNFAIWSGVTGDKIPADYRGGDGPAGLRTKAEIMKFLEDSFAMGHKAAAALTADNLLQPAAGSKSPRLHLATFGVEHAYDSYGQFVEYLRMNGVVPPASR